MDKLTRRALLRTLAGGALSTVGTVILARTSLAALGTPEDTNPADVDVQARAAALDEGDLGSAGEAHAQFLNFGDGGVGFRNGGFGNGGFRQRRLPQRRLPQRWLPQRLASVTVASATVASATVASATAASATSRR